MKFKADEIASVIQQEIEQFESRIDVREVGRVIEVGDGIARVYGLANRLAAEPVDFVFLPMVRHLPRVDGEPVAKSCPIVQASPDMIRQIVDQLRTKLGGEPVIDQQTDPALIGGAVLRVGDTIYDGSIANQLQTLRQHIHQSTAHEIQGRRDRFRHPAGN